MEFAEAMRKSSPGLRVDVIGDLELKVTNAEGRDSTPFLYNAYDAYLQEPAAKADLIHRFAAAALETATAGHSGVDRSRIVPVIKDRPWLAEIRQAMLHRGATKLPEAVYDDFTPDLVIAYAEDSPRNMRYLTPKNLEDTGIDRKELRALACENLKRLLPKIERHGANGLYMLTAGGNYEASLLLLDSIWSGGQMDVRGDIVVAIPTRDLLLVTGSQNPEGIKKVKEMANEASIKGPYRLTPKLFVYRNGQFGEFGGGTERDAMPTGGPSR